MSQVAEATQEGAIDVEFTPPVNTTQMIDNPELQNTDKADPTGELKADKGGMSKDATYQDFFAIQPGAFDDLPAEHAAAEETPENTEQKPADGTEKKEEKPAETPKEEEVKPAETSLVKEIQDVFPEAKSVNEVVEAVGQLRTELDEYKKSNDEVVEVLSKHPALTRILKDVKKGVALFDSIRTHLDIKEGETIPDPAVDPDGYREYVKKQVDRENAMRKEEAEAAERNKVIEAAKDHGEAMRQSFIEKNKIAPDELQRFAEYIQRMTYGDPVTFKLPDNYLEVMYKGFKHDENVAAAEKKGEVIGRNETIQKIITKEKIGDGIPALQSVTTKPKVIDQYTDLEESLKRSTGDPVTAMLNKA